MVVGPSPDVQQLAASLPPCASTTMRPIKQVQFY